MRRFAQTACALYWMMLTVLLLVPNPAALVGMHRAPTLPWGKFGIHLTAFVILTVLVHLTRWPKRVWWPYLTLLAVYAVTTEALQIFVPHRTSRVMDGIENLLGVLIGTCIYWLAVRLTQPAAKLKLASALVRRVSRDRAE